MDIASSLECAWIAVHLFGLTAACLVRIYAGARAEGLWQGTFLVGLAAVAVVTLAGVQCSWPLWTLSAVTMAVMIVVAIGDFRTPQHEPV
jgi:hypothetical protein